MNKNLSNPFEIHSEQTLITIGSIGLILASILAFFLSARFDGFIDMHFVESVSIIQPFIDNIINVLSAVIIFFTLGKILNPKTRIVDILAISLVSRLPFYPLVLVNVNDVMISATQIVIENSNPNDIGNIPPSSLAIILVFALVALAGIIWSIILLYRGFKTATNSKGNSALGYFIIALIITELISKVSIHFFN